MLALLGVLAMSVVTTGSAVAMERPGDKTPPPPLPPCLCGDEQADEPAPEEDESDDGEDEESAAREAVPGRVPAGIRERLVSARRALRDAEKAADAGSDERAAVHVKQARRHLSKAHDAALERAEDELPGGVAAVRAVTSAQHGVITRVTDLALDAEDGLYSTSLATLELAAEDRDEAARFLLETSGTEDELEAIAEEVEEELGALEEIIDDEGTDEDLAEDLSGVAETISGTFEALGLDLREEEEEE
ncbi:hypothetical protein LRS13_24545 [Svornostia abyssi]|uniref:Uncharacterized protein n=1 Tax=Svornostia abyssi TaxID=2898438 RepID=A0ABY5PGP6_9ACTN|nr:hypothetical protein LRS13_24545 [Parviterribacteraceae bacterium J379]